MNTGRLLELCREGLESIERIRGSSFGPVLEPELIKIQAFYDELIPRIEEKWANKNTIDGDTDLKKQYTILSDLYREKNIQKVIHFGDHKNYPNPVLYVLKSVLNTSIDTLASILELYDSKKREYTAGPQKIWIDSFDARIQNDVQAFSKGVPCREAYTGTLQTLLQDLQTGPVEEEVRVIPHVLMKKSDFTSDGGFRRAVRNGLKNYQYVALSIAAFRKALCGAIDNCNEGRDGEVTEVQQAFNLTNFKLFLDVIEFYNNPRYGTESIASFGDVKAILDGYGLDAPYPGLLDSPHCCQTRMTQELYGFEGGRRKRKTRQQKRKGRFRKTKKRALKFSKK